MRTRIAAACLAALLGAAAVVGESRAGDANKTPPRGPTATPTMPQRFVKRRRRIADLDVGASSAFRPGDLWIAPDGVGWILASGLLEDSAASGEFKLPLVRRVAASEWNVDLTGVDHLWATSQGDGSPFIPRTGDQRVGAFVVSGEKPRPTLPDRARGKLLWSLEPGEKAFISALRVCVDARGGAWVYAMQPVRSEPFEDDGGPAVGLVASDRDVVKLDLAGVNHLWFPDAPTRGEALKGAGGFNGHERTVFGVTSFVRDGRTTPRMPSEFLTPQARDAKPGERWFVDPFETQIDADGGVWVYPQASLRARRVDDDWGYPYLGLVRQTDGTFVLDLAGSTFRWCVVDFSGTTLVVESDGSAVAHETRLLKVAKVVDGAKDLGAAVPTTSRAERLWRTAPGKTVHASCRFIGVDKSDAGFVGAWIPVADASFSDESGPSAALALAEDGTCVVDLTGVTNRWETAPTPDFAPTAKPVPGGPRAQYLKVSQFLAPEVDPPPAKPRK